MMDRDGVPLLHDYLIRTARRLPDKVALVSQKQRLTYGDLEARTNALSNALVRRGLERGDRVIVFADNTIETAIAFWAILKANGVVSIVNPSTRADRLAYLLDDCRASVLVTHGHLTPTFAEAAARASHLKYIVIAGGWDERRLGGLAEKAVRWDEALAGEATNRCPPRRNIDVDLAAILYTSGSTGDPKGVMLTHRNMMAAAASVIAYLEMAEDDVILCALPLSFGYGLYQMIMSFQLGARLVLERSFAYPAEVLKQMVAEGVTGFPGVPTIFALLAEMRSLCEYDLSNIRFITNAAAALPIKHILMLRDVFPKARIFSMYGLTECKRATYLPPADIERKPTSIGIAIPNTELWIVDENDNKLGPGEVGQLVIRGANVMQGYWGKPEATAERLRPGPVLGETVLYTGDLCKLDEEGYLYFVSRMDDIIKSGGEKIAPKEVETALMNIPGVKEAAVIGVPDNILGLAVKAIVVLEQGASLTEKEIIRACQGSLANYMVPRYIDFVAGLPKTSSGKLKKTDLS